MMHQQKIQRNGEPITDIAELAKINKRSLLAKALPYADLAKDTHLYYLGL